MKQTIKIVALSVDSTKLTLWTADGNTVRIAQGNPIVPRIVAEAKSLGLAPGKPVTVDITPEAVKHNEYNQTEKGTNGLVRFFRVTRAKLASFFHEEEPEKAVEIIPAMELGKVPNTVEGKLAHAAVDKMVVISAIASEVVPPPPTVKEDYTRNLVLYITGYDKTFDKKDDALHKIVAAMTGHSSSSIANLLHNDDVTSIAELTESMAEVYGPQLEKIKGLHFVIQPYQVDAPAAYVEPVKPAEVAKTNAAKLADTSARLDALGAISTGDDSFHADLKEDETIVAVVGDKVIPDVQHLQRQIRQSAKLQDYKGFTRFLERLSSVIGERRHSVEDLMKFMERGDLPIADDGCIVIYKRLESKTNPEHLTGKVYVDVHSRRIEQQIGTLVRVKDELVDQNRRQDCSNGLHVASLSYLSSFSGGITIIGKVAPEDVFAVPEYSTNKMRVSAYHIIAELTQEQRRVVNSGGSITSVEGGTELLNSVLTGNHSAPINTVTVGGHNGTNLTYARLSTSDATVDLDSGVVKNKKTLDMQESLTASANVAEPVKATDVKAAPTKKKTKMEEMQELWKQFDAATGSTKVDIADKMVAMKGAAKKSWGSLGIEQSKLDAIIAARANKPVPAEKPVAKPKAVKSAPAKKSSTGDSIRQTLHDAGINDFTKAHIIHDLKRAAKKSYGALGLSVDDVRAIDKLKHHLK